MTKPAPAQKSDRAIIKCAEWLAFCLSIGWSPKDLDELERIWWSVPRTYSGDIL